MKKQEHVIHNLNIKLMKESFEQSSTKDNRITKKSIIRNLKYYETLGHSKGLPSNSDFYRYKRVISYICGKTVLDVGCGRADFLKMIKADYKIAGIEVNMERVKYCNKILGKNVVMLGNLEKKINIDDSYYDTVVCIEVLEHLMAPQEALKELIRISKIRVIITVPFNEKIKWFLCVHCAKYTPMFGHFHSFTKENIKYVIPNNGRIIKIELICNKVLNYVPGLSSIFFRLPIQISSILDKIFNRIFPRVRWMIVILDKIH